MCFFSSQLGRLSVLFLLCGAAQTDLLGQATPDSTLDTVGFEASESYPVGPLLSGTHGWQVRFGSAEVVSNRLSGVTATQGPHNPVVASPQGTQSLCLVGGSRPSVEVSRVLGPPPAVTFVDFYLLPSVVPEDYAQSTIQINGSHLAFLRGNNHGNTQGGGVGLVYALNGSDGNVSTSSPVQPWEPASLFPLNAPVTHSLNWLRITLRQDHVANRWDLFVDGKLALADLHFDGHSATSSYQWLAFGSESAADVWVDNIRVSDTNPLLAVGETDANRDGIVDQKALDLGAASGTADRTTQVQNPATTIVQAVMDQTHAVRLTSANPALIDTDGDGMPDLWEDTYSKGIFGLNKNDPSDRDLDFDRDGKTNFQEYQAGTTPVSPPLYEAKPLCVEGLGTNWTIRDYNQRGEVLVSCLNDNHTELYCWKNNTLTKIPLDTDVVNLVSVSINDGDNLVVAGTWQKGSDNYTSQVFRAVFANGSWTVQPLTSQATFSTAFVARMGSHGTCLVAGTPLGGVAQMWLVKPLETLAVSSPLNFTGAIYWHINFCSENGMDVLISDNWARLLKISTNPPQAIPALNATWPLTYEYYSLSLELSQKRATSTQSIPGQPTALYQGNLFGVSYHEEGLTHLWMYPSGIIKLNSNGLNALAGVTGRGDFWTYDQGLSIASFNGTDPQSTSNWHNLDGSIGYQSGFILDGNVAREFTSRDWSGKLSIWRNGTGQLLSERTKLPPGYSFTSSWDGTFSGKLTNQGEILTMLNFHGTDLPALLQPLSEPDQDGDGLPDAWEVAHGMNPLNPLDGESDPDQDGLSNRVEFLKGSLPDKRDSDGDGMPDRWEVENRLDPANPSNALADSDADGLTNLQEYYAHTNPWGNYELQVSTGISADAIAVAAVNEAGHILLSAGVYDFASNYNINTPYLWKSSTDCAALNFGYSAIGIDLDNSGRCLFSADLGSSTLGYYFAAHADNPQPSYLGFGFLSSQTQGYLDETGKCFFQEASPADLFPTRIYGWTFSTQPNSGQHFYPGDGALPSGVGSFDAPFHPTWADRISLKGAAGGTASGVILGQYESAAGQVQAFVRQRDTADGLLLPPNLSALDLSPNGTKVLLWGTPEGLETGLYVKDLSTPARPLLNRTPSGWTATNLILSAKVNDSGHVVCLLSYSGLVFVTDLATVSLSGLVDQSMTGLAIQGLADYSNSGYIAGPATYQGNPTFYRLRITNDANSDGLPDDWVVYHFGSGSPSLSSPTFASDDADGDLLTNQEEYLHGTDPLLSDTDGDGLSDAAEVTAHTDPLTSRYLTMTTPYLSEIMAKTTNTYPAPVGSSQSDWVEIYNPTSQPVDLSGWMLKDNSPGWTFPTGVILQPYSYLVVLCDNTESVPPPYTLGQILHSNFIISSGSSGETVSLLKPEANLGFVTINSLNAGNVGSNDSYGIDSESGRIGDLYVGTPGQPNGHVRPVLGPLYLFESETEFLAASGFLNTSRAVSLRALSGQSSTHVFYTLDGSAPIPTNPKAYVLSQRPSFPLETTTVLRAQAYRDSQPVSVEATRTWIFADDVLAQTRPDGYPTFADPNKATPSTPWHYDMTASAVAAAGHENVKNALSNLPSISLILPQEEFFGETGIGTHPWLRDSSVTAQMEGLGFSPSGGFQTAASLEIHGNASRSLETTVKQSFKLSFRKSQGVNKLSYPVFNGTDNTGAPNNLNEILLRSPVEDSWAVNKSPDGQSDWSSLADEATYLRDAFAAETQKEMGIPTPRRRWVNLYLNGLYWGVYELMEQPDADFFAASSPSSNDNEDDFYVIKDGEVQQGGVPATAAWDDLHETARLVLETEFKHHGLLPLDGPPFNPAFVGTAYETERDARYAALAAKLDLTAFADYIILNGYLNNEDWPVHNWVAFRSTSPNSQFAFRVWDADWTLRQTDLEHLEPRFWTRFQNQRQGPGYLFGCLSPVPQFQTLFANRLAILLTGPLHPTAAQNRMAALAQSFAAGFPAEFARWGMAYPRTLSSANFYAQSSNILDDLKLGQHLAFGHHEASLALTGGVANGPATDPSTYWTGIFSPHPIDPLIQVTPPTSTFPSVADNPGATGSPFSAPPGANPPPSGFPAPPSGQLKRTPKDYVTYAFMAKDQWRPAELLTNFNHIKLNPNTDAEERTAANFANFVSDYHASGVGSSDNDLGGLIFTSRNFYLAAKKLDPECVVSIEVKVEPSTADVKVYLGQFGVEPLVALTQLTSTDLPADKNRQLYPILNGSRAGKLVVEAGPNAAGQHVYLTVSLNSKPRPRTTSSNGSGSPTYGSTGVNAALPADQRWISTSFYLPIEVTEDANAVLWGLTLPGGGISFPTNSTPVYLQSNVKPTKATTPPGPIRMEVFQARAWKIPPPTGTPPPPEPVADLKLPRDKGNAAEPDYFLIRPNNDLDEQIPPSTITTADYDFPPNNPAWGEIDDDLIRIKLSLVEYWPGLVDIPDSEKNVVLIKGNELRIWWSTNSNGIGAIEVTGFSTIPAPNPAGLLDIDSDFSSLAERKIYTKAAWEATFGSSAIYFFVETSPIVDKIQVLRIRAEVGTLGNSYETSQSISVNLIPVQIVVDANRDGIITFDGKDSITSKEKPFVFWVNDDRDFGSADNADDITIKDRQVSDHQNDVIDGARDLEDFTRLTLKFEGIEEVLKNGETLLCFSIDPKSGGNPAFNLWLHTENKDGPRIGPGRKYVEDADFANDYLQTIHDVSNSTSNIKCGPYFCSKSKYLGFGKDFWSKPLSFYPASLLKSERYFLVEGVTPGKFLLNVELRDTKLNVISKLGSVWIEFKKIDDMYEHYVCGDVDGKTWEEINQIPIPPQPFNYLFNGVSNQRPYLYPPVTSDTPDLEKDYILFVHGWRMLPEEKIAFANTAYKRLWHRGYQGRFGIFTWPTEWCWTDNLSQFWNEFPAPHITLDARNFDRSERKAYSSAQALRYLMRFLKNQYGSRVNVMAHSMGNIVVSEALRYEINSSNPEVLINSYSACQSAVASHAYDNTNPEILTKEFIKSHPTFNHGLLSTGTLFKIDAALSAFESIQPNAYGHYPHGNDSEGEYFAGIQNAVKNNNIYNFHNRVDYALGLFLINQWQKPDEGWGYDFIPATDLTHTISSIGPSHFTTNTKLWFRGDLIRTPDPNVNYIADLHELVGIDPKELTFPSDRYEIFAQIAEAKSPAIGSAVGNGHSVLKVIKSSIGLYNGFYNFDNKSENHSGQFRGTNMLRWKFWQKMIKVMEIETNQHPDGGITKEGP